ncbi:hypothetical protein OQA88_7389 [Cercophora sp. LCS_1]
MPIVSSGEPRRLIFGIDFGTTDLARYLSAGAMSHLAKMRDIIWESGKIVLDIVSDYLRAFWQHTLEQVASHIGAEVLERSPFTVVVTVPAMWKNHVRSRMRGAIVKAGTLDKKDTIFHFVSEPEAAALARLYDLHASGSVQRGDRITVADFGQRREVLFPDGTTSNVILKNVTGAMRETHFNFTFNKVVNNPQSRYETLLNQRAASEAMDKFFSEDMAISFDINS